MSEKNSPASMPIRVSVWPYPLPSTLVLMVPFDLLASLAMDVYLPVIPQMPSALNASASLVQLTLSTYILILGLGQILFGPLSDHMGRRPVLLSGALLFSTASLGLAMTGSGAVFLALRLLQALGASAALVAMFATVRDVYANRPEGSTIYGLFSSILVFVPALGPILGTLIALSLGWRAIFLMLGTAGLLATVHAWLRWHETRLPTMKTKGLKLLPILSSKAFWVYTIGFSTAMGSFFVFFSTAPRVLMDHAHFSQTAFSLAFASVAAVMIVATRFAGFFVSKWGISGCFVRGLLVMAVSAVVLAASTALAAPGFLTFIMPMWLMAIGINLVVSVTANGALQDFDDTAGTAVAMYYCVQSLMASGLGTLAILALNGRTAWPLVAYGLTMSTVSLAGFVALRHCPEDEGA